MNQYLKTIQDILQQNKDLSEADKEALIKAITDADKQWSITDFKLDRTEKVKKTTAILLEETIEELEQKRKAVEAQNRELEIESSLEKVRTVAMGMRKRDDMMDICRMMSKQLESLGIKEIRNVQTAIFYQDKGIYVNYEYYRLHDKALVTEVDYTKDKISIEFAAQMTRGADEFFTRSLAGKEVKDWFNFQKTTNVFIDTYLEKAESLTYYWFSLGPVAIGMSSYVPLSEGDLNIFKRFRNVFGLAYQRYIDIEQAEAQARESQIQLALERVRARSLAMHHTSELQEVVNIAAQQLLNINIDINGGVFIIINNEVAEDIPFWASSGAADYVQKVVLPFRDIPIISRLRDAIRSGNNFHVEEYSLEEKIEFFEHLFRHSPWNLMPPKRKRELLGREGGLTRSVTIAQHTSIGITNHFGKKFSDADNDVLKRFGNVLEQSYIRFLDLIKAEAQAKEAEIELSLERVRSKAMAMHGSGDILATTTTAFEELKKLGIHSIRCGIGLFSKNSMEAQVYASTTDSNGVFQTLVGTRDMNDHPSLIRQYQSWLKQENLVDAMSGEELKLYYNKLFFQSSSISATRQNFDNKQSGYYFSFADGMFYSWTDEPYTENEINILNRFKAIVALTFRRFLDLQKAETQAREAKIEVAMERTRTQSMVMQHSKELDDTLRVFHQQVLLLNIHSAFSFLWLPDEEKDRHIFWAAWGEDKNGSTIFKSKAINYPLDRNEPATAQCLVDWKSNEPIVSYHVPPSGVENYFVAWQELIDGVEQLRPEYFSGGLYYIEAFMKYGCFGVMVVSDLTEDEKKILGRFAIEFERTYTRFLDLQKAEAQAREAQIEAALERVRARSMAMHKSDELLEVINVVSEQLQRLKIKFGFVSFGFIGSDLDFDFWLASPGFALPERIHAPYIDNPIPNTVIEAQKKGLNFFTNTFSAKDNNQWLQLLIEDNKTSKILETTKNILLNSPGFARSAVILKNINIFIGNYVPKSYSNEENEIIRRFASVFEQSYTRFLDLQKAEAQAREAQIEAALERVRARTMAMHNSVDVTSATETLFEELKKLGIDNLRCGIANIHQSRTFDVFGVTHLTGNNTMSGFGFFGMDEHPIWQRWFESWKNKEEVFIAYIAGKEKEEYFNNINEHLNYLPQKIIDFPDSFFQAYYFEQGAVWVYSLLQHSEQEKEIMRRFALGFSLTFRRYQDLKKAEAQTRQAQIETAMEKVRARALAMQKPEELVEVAEVLRKEMGLLGVEELETSSIYIHDEASGNTECWYAIKKIKDDETKLVTDHMIIKLQDTWVGRQMLGFYHSDKIQISIPMQGDNRKEWIHYCTKHSKAFEGFYGENIPDRTYHLNKFSNGYIGAASPGDISAESWELLQRATSVFSLAYTRFSDLQIAEASTREAVRQASLDRVRAEIASMRTMNDLQRITPLIWNELTILGVPFIRCGVFIMDEDQKLIHTFLSTPEGKAIAAFHLPYDTPGNFTEVVNNWHRKHIYIDHWGEPEFISMADTLVKQGAIERKEQYLNTLPQGGFYLHFLPFLQGMLYVANTTQLGDDEIKLIQSVAGAFSTAYARYEDFNRLEAAKQQVDKTLIDLKQTQTQLIQSEKMASLGELTAGIAHEIQNPLNFVNNFSDVSNELLEEMKTELEKGNKEDAMAIADDVKQNLEKILHHGKRADAIVKGMLQHSRTSSGQKEMTDINTLCDEYLRLAYHGLRAKDKSFNAKLETDLDKNAGKVNVIPQDIGRVLVNLINNAFYAVNEKAKKHIPGYEPTVSLTTKKVGDKVELRVIDNGNGIPQKVLEKIFQPFFTTKPTGQGTGLGLSLAYDIITKGHGGELKVKTKEGEGSEFCIQIPVSKTLT